MRKVLEAQLTLLEWVIRLTYCGMPIGMIRRQLLIRHEMLLKQLEKGGGGDKSSTA